METDSDSDGSHISGTPQREEESKPSETTIPTRLLSLVSSYKSKIALKKTRVSSSFSVPKPFSNHKNPKPKPKTKSKPKSRSPQQEEKPLLNLKLSSPNLPNPKTPKPKPNFKTQSQPPTQEDPKLSPPDSSNPIQNNEVSSAKTLSFPQFNSKLSLPDFSNQHDEMSSAKILPMGFSRKFSNAGRTYSNPESTTENVPVPVPQPEIVNSDHIEVVGKHVNVVTPEISTSSLMHHVNAVIPEISASSTDNHQGAECVKKPARKHPNSIGGSDLQPLPSKKARPANEMNFVRLNINGYGGRGRKFLNKKGKGRSSSSSYSSHSRKSKWRSSKGKSKAEGEENESNGICDEDGLVSELPKEQEECEKTGGGYAMVEKVAMDARNDPSDENLLKLLKCSHGYDSFREGQLEAIKNVVAGNSTMLVLPTGAGKSLCYQLPALMLPGLTLVVSPLVALMVDQLKQLPPMIQGGLLSSNQFSEEASDTICRLVEGKIKVLYVSPERFLNKDFLSLFGPTLLVSLVVIDEAHCLSEWSHNFRPSYLRLRSSLLREKLNVKCILAMTATATTKTLQAVMSALEIPQTSLIKTSQTRENLQLSVTLSGNRMKDLLMLMKSSPFTDIRSTIIYCKFQSETDLLSKYLRDNNISAKSYHSGIPAKDRSQTQELFCSNKIRVVRCFSTVAFGMGLNKSDVGAVIHYSLPESLEEYVQEIGRAGRDGRLSYCHLFFDDLTYFKLRSFSFSDGVDEFAVNKFLCQVFSNAVCTPGKIFSLVKESASQKLDMKEEVMLTILTYLEIGEVQYLRLLPQLNVTCSLYFHKTSPALLASKDIVVAAILKKSEIKQGAYVFDIPTVANSTGVTAIDLSKHLQTLKLNGEVTYEVKDLALCYMVMKTPGDFCALTAHLTRWLSEVESCKVKKLDEMFSAATFAVKICDKVDGCSGTQHTKCLQSRILDYFNREDNDPRCDFSTKMGQSSPFLRADVKVFLQSNTHAKFTPRAVARIMHGIGSPSFPSATWSKTHLWGRYAQVDFQVVMEAATAELMNFAGRHIL
ncbi:ATP-dependent DNA helicase Q-like 5 [Papaver somniferum]|uniref:ATP-dependent DNA helicase Q-like 5 n=1 Tax=Papaver somniferum TaxID=3469 RepID=UPI000E6FA2E5|nr:ATP-dependent DNA helicase Q-like 5 [Papaver somniferum]